MSDNAEKTEMDHDAYADDVDVDADQDDEPEMLDWSGVKTRENAKRQATKTFTLEYPDGTQAVFEYQMVEDVGALSREHMTRKPTRTGEAPELEMSEDAEWAFAADLLREAIVSAPDGFKPTERELRQGLTKPVLDEIVEAVTNFSTMDSETFIRFR